MSPPLLTLCLCQANGYIRRDRVCGDLDMARTLGDFEYKTNRALPPAEQIISPWPDVRTLAVSSEDLFLVGGVWLAWSAVQCSAGLCCWVTVHRGADGAEHVRCRCCMDCLSGCGTQHDCCIMSLHPLLLPHAVGSHIAGCM